MLLTLTIWEQSITIAVTSGVGPRAVGAERGRWTLMIMSDTCTTHRSRVPRRSSGWIKGGVTTMEDERGPGLDFYFVFCMWQSFARGCRLLSFYCLFISLLKCLNVCRFPPLSSRINELCYIGAESWEEGGTRCQKSPRCWGGSRCWGGRAARRSGDRQCLPEAVVLER